MLFGTAGTIIGVVAYIPYVLDTLTGKTKPHAFSWLISSILLFVGFGIQLMSGAGPSTWVLAAEAVPCALLFVLALFKGERDIKPIDWICLLAAFAGIILWIFVHQALLALILVMSVDTLGFVPTVRKAFMKPQEETLVNWFLIAISFGVSLFAIDSFAIESWLYSAFLFVVNVAFTLYLIVRRRQLHLS